MPDQSTRCSAFLERLTVLVIEDDESEFGRLRDLAEQLDRWDTQFEWADSYANGLKELTRNTYDICFLDQFLGGHTAIEMLKQLRAAHPTCRTPIVVLTDEANEDADQASISIGATDVLPKPELNATTLDRLIRHTLERTQMQRALRDREAHNRAIIEAIPDLIVRIDREGALIDVQGNRGLLGRSETNGFRPKHLRDLPVPHQYVEEHLLHLKRALYTGNVQDFEFQFTNGNGLRVFETHVSPSSSDEAVSVIRDISDRRQAERDVYRSAFYDSLTGLPNRCQFIERLERAVRRAREFEDYHFVLLFLDIDRFKTINDSLGHQIGDELLCKFGERLLFCVRDGDMVARLGGDEFTILANGIGSAEEVMRIAQRIQHALNKPVRLGKNDVVVTASIGVAMSTPECKSPEEMLRDADTAMYRAKDEGSGSYALFDQEMHEAVVTALNIEGDLRRALDSDQLFLEYQPIISARTGAIDGLEALLRWKHPVEGRVPPDRFIPIAEEANLIRPLGSWVLNEACRQMAVWRANYGETTAALRIGVNVSPIQFGGEYICEQVYAALESSGLPPEFLALEITESTLLRETERVIRTIHRLKEMGVRIYMDDFGTGYSSLSYLTQLPIDAIKVDRSFVLSMHERGKDEEVVRAIIAMAKVLDLEVIAEGVESDVHQAKLREFGCDRFQGYHFSRPLSKRRIEEIYFRKNGALASNYRDSASGQLNAARHVPVV